MQLKAPKITILQLTLVATVAASLSVCLLAQTKTPSQASPDVSAPNSRFQDRVFQSESLSRAMKYRVLLPAGYFESAKNYPVLYLLHGWYGDYQNWSTLTNLAYYAE